ncbi:MMPL family transporter [Kitasatospora atroaurantiaca]|uniref:RND superfamily putative drug exporter n=1 Tax=Kitasatospora atroaurantiaca TaxID=285545 RepID=A0A561ELI2_9ACTN|nr:MMPL family transporter [Kitasatospora atroaurantiaca]TWE16476.1 RND superfamily putative drug exporter [Kitasatospora atroaurantiaca]
MFHRIGHFVVKRAWWVIIAWIVAAVAIIGSAPKLDAQTDESSFLPRHYESIQASLVQEKAFPANFTPAAMLLFERTDGGKLTDADQAAMNKVVQGLTDKHVALVEKILPVSPQSTSKDGKYALSMVAMEKNTAHKPEAADSAKLLRDDAKQLADGSSLKVQLGGQAAQNLDQKDSSELANALIGIGTIVIILLTLGIIFRSPIIALLPVLSIFVFSMVANGLIADASKAFGLKADSSVSAILIIVLFGVGTDYFLFLMFRYRERLRAGDDRKEAVVNAVGRVGEAIASAAGAVIVAFSVLVLSSLGMFKALGPSLAIAVAVTAIASVTLVPAVLSLIPEKVLFWPSKAWQREPENARFAALGRTVERRPALVAIVSGALMLALSFAAFGYKGTFDLASGSMPKTKESMVVQDTLMTAFSAGAADPSHIYLTTTEGGAKLDAAALDGYASQLGKVDGVAQVVPKPNLSADGTTADFTVMLKDAPATNAAIDTVGKLRTVAHDAAPQGTKAYVGGITSVYKDINTAMARDYSLVFPIAALLIMVILGLLLRSVVAPWYLMAAVGLGFGATIGATSLLFQQVQGEAGLMFMLPMFIYLFVVAIGTDYNILMIARLREEVAEGHSPRKAARMAIQHGGPTVAAAGAILAATFGTMLLAGNSLFSQIGFSVAFGIAVSAFVMALFFTPALTALLGRAAWWPGHGEVAGHEAAAPVALRKDDPEPAGRR